MGSLYFDMPSAFFVARGYREIQKEAVRGNIGGGAKHGRRYNGGSI
jgi:hypothetical protein